MDEEKRLLIYKLFVVVRLLSGLSCFDLFEACPDLDVELEFIRNFFLRDKPMQEEEGIDESAKNFIDTIKSDDLNSFICL